MKQKVYITPTEKNGNKNLIEQSLELNSSISLIEGVGSVRQKILNECGIFTLNDLLYNFPRRHLDRTTITPIRKIQKGDNVTLIASVETCGEKPIRRGKIFQVIVSDGTGLLTLSWFNGIRYIKNNFKIGSKLAIHGKVDWYNGYTISHPEFEILEKDEDPILTGKVIPLYNLNQGLKSGGIDQRFFRKVIKFIITSGIKIPELFQKIISMITGYDRIINFV